jgi:hypothetical protein
LDDVRHVSAIDLEMESNVPSEIGGPENNQTPVGLAGGAANRDRRNTNQDQKTSADVASQSHHGFDCSTNCFGVSVAMS